MYRVSIHASGGEATLPGGFGSLRPFQSTPPGGRRLAGIFGPYDEPFQSTPPGGGDGPAIYSASWDNDVSIHASGGEATERAYILALLGFQSTPPGGRRQMTILSIAGVIVSIHASGGEATSSSASTWSALPVSIHASGGEATENHLQGCRRCVVSIHASGGEATGMRLARVKHPGFNPRLRGGGDCNIWGALRLQDHI